MLIITSLVEKKFLKKVLPEKKISMFLVSFKPTFIFSNIKLEKSLGFYKKEQNNCYKCYERKTIKIRRHGEKN